MTWCIQLVQLNSQINHYRLKVYLLLDPPRAIILLSLEVCTKSIFVREVGGMSLFRGVHSTVREGQGPQLGLRMKQEHMETCFIRHWWKKGHWSRPVTPISPGCSNRD
jgi:hypothetical protein